MVGGENIEVSDNQIWVTDHPFIFDCANGIVARNQFLVHGDLGRYWIRSCKNLIFEENEVGCGGALANYNVNFHKEFSDQLKYTVIMGGII